MVSFFRSHCHSASETFIGSTCCCTRSMTLRRTASSSSWSRSTSTITASCSASGSSDGQMKYSLRFPLNRTSTIGVNSFLAQSTHRKVLLLAAFEQLLHLGLAEQAHMAAQRVPQSCRGRVGVGVGAPGRLG